MSITELLQNVERRRATTRARQVSFLVALWGAVGVGVLLFLLRLGVRVPGLALLELEREALSLARVFDYVAVSIAGLIQGAAMMLVVFVVSFCVRRFAAPAFRRRRGETARDIDTHLECDRYSAALEARGAFRTLVEKRALANAPPKDILAGRGPGRLRSWLLRFAVLLALAVALMPGTAAAGSDPDEKGEEPTKGKTEQPLELRLVGPGGRYDSDEPIHLQAVLEARSILERDFQERVVIVLDKEKTFATNKTLFLAAGAPGQDAVLFDLRELAKTLKPGKHEAVAHCGGLESNPYVFQINPGDGGGSGGGGDPNQEDPKSKSGQGGGEKKDKNITPKFVKPLVREGETVKKRARVLTESRGGGAPQERSIKEAWPELERRKEAALKRPGLSPSARKLVREYFEKLRPEEQD